jgi:hypothetical protein
MKSLERLFGLITRRRKRYKLELLDPTGAKMRTLVPICLVCNAGTARHSFARIASMPCNEESKDRVKALFDQVKNHEWETLKNCHEFRADQDDVIVYAVTGQHDGGMVVLTRDPADLYARVEIYLEETLTAQEVVHIKDLVAAEEWREL